MGATMALAISDKGNCPRHGRLRTPNRLNTTRFPRNVNVYVFAPRQGIGPPNCAQHI